MLDCVISQNSGERSCPHVSTWNPNASLATLGITDPFNSSNTQTCNYNADDLSRISKANCGAIWGQSFAYDPFGNISKSVLSGSAGTSFLPTYQASPSITNRISSLPGGFAPTYDANGNSTNDSFNQYTWDADNNPVSIINSSGTVTLTYYAFDRMVEQARGTSYTQIVYSPLGGKLAKMNGATLQTAYIPLPSGGQAIYTSSGLAYYRHSDHLGSSRFASTPTQTMYASTAYSAFGEPYAQTTTKDPSFTGQDQDTTAGVYDFLFRKYDPGQSRWTSPDPAGLASVNPTAPQSWNRYAYVLNNPLTDVDPAGLTCFRITVDENGFTSEQEISAADKADCDKQEGFWINDVNTSVYVPSGVDDDGTLAGGCASFYQDGVYIGNVCDGPTMSAGTGGGGSKAKTPWYKNSCITGAIGTGLLHVGIDAIGLIPEGGLISRAVGNFAGYRGIVATQQGTKALQGVKAAAGIGATGVNSDETSSAGLISSGLGVAGIAATLASAAPGVGQGIAVVSIGVDIFGAGKEIANCH